MSNDLVRSVLHRPPGASSASQQRHTSSVGTYAYTLVKLPSPWPVKYGSTAVLCRLLPCRSMSREFYAVGLGRKPPPKLQE